PAGQGLGHPTAVAAGVARDVLLDGAARVARLPDRAAELPRPRRPAPQARVVARELRRFRRHDRTAPRALRAAAAGRRLGLPRSRLAHAPAPRAARAAREALAGHADRAAPRFPRDGR